MLESSLKPLKNSCFGREFCPTFDFTLIMFMEWSSGVKPPSIGGLKHMRLTLAKRQTLNMNSDSLQVCNYNTNFQEH